MLEYLNTSLKTLVIIPNKYHNFLYQKLLKDSKMIFNISLLSIDTFFLKTLNENQVEFNNESNLINKLNLANKLIKVNHSLCTNVNYIDELAKLEQEFITSNVSLTPKLGYHISYDKKSFENLKINYDQIIIYTKEDFKPIHQEFISSLNSNIIELKNDHKPFYQLYEHNNVIRMLDYLVYELYSLDNYQSTLVICDDPLQRDYLINKLSTFNIPYQLDSSELSVDAYKLRSIANYINDSYTKYDISNIKQLYIDITALDKLKVVKYSEYIEKLYHILVDTKLFDINFLNVIFKDLYLLKETNHIILNSYLFDTLASHLTLTNNSSDNALMLAKSDFSSFHFENVYLIDASFKGMTPTKTSYLLNTQQRNTIDKNLIDNPYYAQELKMQQDRLLNCGTTINIHYSLINLDNKPQALAFFIDSLELDLSNKTNYKHLVTKQMKKNFTKDNSFLDSQLILNRLNDEVTLSATSMDSFFQCPYQYFVNYILKPAKSKEFSYLNTGTLNHEIMEEINHYLITENISYKQLDDTIIQEIIDNKLASNFIVFQDRYNLNNYDLLKIASRTDKIIKSNIEALQYYEKFSAFNLHSSELKLEHKLEHPLLDKVKLVGKIDVIMKYNDYHYILDYKSSTKKFNETAFVSGISNQLITYLSLLKNSEMNITGAFFKPIKDNYEKSNNILDTDYNKQLRIDAQKLDGILIENPFITKFDSSLSEESPSTISTARYTNGRSKGNIIDFEKLIEYLRIFDNHTQRMLSDIAKGSFPILPYEEASCTYCDYKNICKINKSFSTRKELEQNE